MGGKRSSGTMTHKPENKIETEICKEEIVEGGETNTQNCS